MNTYEEVKEFVKQLKALLIQRHKIELEHKLYELESDLIEYGTLMLEQNYDLGWYNRIHDSAARETIKKNNFERFNSIKRYFFTQYNELNEYIVNHSSKTYSDEYYKQNLDKQNERFNDVLKQVHAIIEQRKADNKNIVEDSC